MRFYFDLFLSFFKIGLFTIGGGYVMIPLLREECVRKKKWFSEEEFVDIVTISQSTPGVLAINMSIFIGYKLKKLKGALITTLGTILPSFIIILLFAIFLAKYGELEIIQKI
ncbi:MAG: chromate transporter, partial [Paludibacteraceae bacterium]|nr:chromate transporter [Paludibacteraceae bacterium]